MARVDLSVQEYLELLEALKEAREGVSKGLESAREVVALPKKAKKRVSAYNRKYKKAFKKVSDKYRSKNGKWLKNGFKRAVKEAHKVAKK